MSGDEFEFPVISSLQNAGKVLIFTFQRQAWGCGSWSEI
jgi:hypothetical protein